MRLHSNVAITVLHRLSSSKKSHCVKMTLMTWRKLEIYNIVRKIFTLSLEDLRWQRLKMWVQLLINQHNPLCINLRGLGDVKSFAFNQRSSENHRQWRLLCLNNKKKRGQKKKTIDSWEQKEAVLTTHLITM